MGHFMDRPRSIPYVYNKLEDSQDFKFLREDKELYRIFPQSTGDEFRFYPNMNIHYGIESIYGHDPLLLKSYGTITGFPQDPDYGIDEIEIVRNNVIISMLNTKYIFLQKPPDTEELLQKIEKNYYIDSGVIFKFNDYIKQNPVYTKNLTPLGELTLTDTKNNTEVF